MLGGWLHRHTCFTASNLLRAEVRRQNREREAVQMNTLHAAPDNAWVQLGPVLDEAIDQLESADREAIVLRYFEQQDLRTVGAAFGIGEDAAQKRVSRAVDKLRELVTRKGGDIVGDSFSGGFGVRRSIGGARWPGPESQWRSFGRCRGGVGDCRRASRSCGGNKNQTGRRGGGDCGGASHSLAPAKAGEPGTK
jgi:hypothetical protein